MTEVASAHSALAGVLAAVVLVILPITLPAPSEVETGQHANASHAQAKQRDVTRLLILAFITLVLAAIVWGSLTGNPSLSELGDEANGGRLLLAQNLIIGGCGVVLLAVGALAVLAGLLEYLRPALGDTPRQEYEVPAVLLVALTVFEGSLFATMATSQLVGGAPAWVSYAVPLVLALGWVARPLWKSRNMILRQNNTKRRETRVVEKRFANLVPTRKWARVTVVAAMAVYVLQPLSDPYAATPGDPGWHWISVALLWVTVGLAAIFALHLSAFVARDRDLPLPPENL